MSERPLAGRKVLVTRPRGRGEPLARRLSDLGATVDLLPTIAFEPPDDRTACRQALAAVDRYDWLVFTSVNGVRFFVGEFEGVPPKSRVAGGVAAVGPGTARALRQAGLEPTRVAADGHAEALAEELARDGLAGKRVLVVRPERGRDVLPRLLGAAGARVDAVAFYRTVAAAEASEAAERLAAGRYDAAVFTSPSTLSFLLAAAGARRQAVRTALGRAGLVAIGRVTADALRREGLRADRVADRPDEQAIVEAVSAVARR